MIILSRRKIEICQTIELILQFRSASPSDLGVLPETQYELIRADEVKIIAKFIMPK